MSLQQGSAFVSYAFQQLQWSDAMRSMAALGAQMLVTPQTIAPLSMQSPPAQQPPLPGPAGLAAAGASLEEKEMSELEQMFASGPPSARRTQQQQDAKRVHI